MAIIGFITIILLLIFSRPITTFIHELGHAIPALLFTSHPVVIFVGSYGNETQSQYHQIGRLHIYFKYNVLNWQLGLCQHAPANKIYETLLIILGGPVASLLLGLICIYFLIEFKEQPWIAFSIALLLVSGISDFLVNIIPDDKPLPMENGAVVYNDGAQFKQLLKTSRYPEEYFSGLEDINEGRPKTGISKLESVLESGVKDIYIYKYVIQIYIQEKQENNAIQFHERFVKRLPLDSSDHLYAAELYIKNNQTDFALQELTTSIEKNYLNSEALLTRGKLLLEMGHRGSARKDLEKVLLIEEGNREALELLNG